MKYFIFFLLFLCSCSVQESKEIKGRDLKNEMFSKIEDIRDRFISYYNIESKDNLILKGRVFYLNSLPLNFHNFIESFSNRDMDITLRIGEFRILLYKTISSEGRYKYDPKDFNNIANTELFQHLVSQFRSDLGDPLEVDTTDIYSEEEKTILINTLGLFKAIETKNYSIVGYYLNNTNADLNHYSEKLKKTPFLLALDSSDLEIIKLFLKQLSTDYEFQNEECLPALHYCVENNMPNVLALLLQNNVNNDIQDNNGDTPIIRSYKNGQVKMFETLMNNGANPFLQNYSKSSVLSYMIRDSQKLKSKLIYNLFDKKDTLEGKVYVPNISMIRKFVHILLRSKDEFGEPILFSAMNQGGNEVNQLLFLDKGFLDIPKSSGDLPFIHAVKSLQLEYALLFANKKKNTNSTLDTDSPEEDFDSNLQKFRLSTLKNRMNETNEEIRKRHKYLLDSYNRLKGTGNTEGNYTQYLYNFFYYKSAYLESVVYYLKDKFEYISMTHDRSSKEYLSYIRKLKNHFQNLNRDSSHNIQLIGRNLKDLIDIEGLGRTKIIYSLKERILDTLAYIDQYFPIDAEEHIDEQDREKHCEGIVNCLKEIIDHKISFHNELNKLKIKSEMTNQLMISEIYYQIADTYSYFGYEFEAGEYLDLGEKLLKGYTKKLNGRDIILPNREWYRLFEVWEKYIDKTRLDVFDLISNYYNYYLYSQKNFSEQVGYEFIYTTQIKFIENVYPLLGNISSSVYKFDQNKDEEGLIRLKDTIITFIIICYNNKEYEKCCVVIREFLNIKKSLDEAKI